ncbi:enoyl-CoA hydratase/isomerase family protein [Paralcaligenes ureilyticus]|uniref:Enoyl-CoA hydratase/carnithine racemase n=1 Tax=Paralcaligenes ureilyticus TaxID=627131 RepID=A0A4R3M8A0_9BURK|nr:enoyl-CoA hydratase-related protein [Paralcaligenes ureilyticus]TCT09600.1 enoyl-CoA hydratase/carnithine racemase [Paralcaligenes ureilyticus]
MEKTVLFEVRERVAYITLNRPDKKNAINRAMRKEIQDAYLRVKTDPGIWAAVLTGNGEVFCSGKDLMEKNLPEDDDGSIMSNDELYLFQRFIYKPIVLALNGPCLAQGGGFALNADIVVFSERASIGWPQVKRGISSVSGPSFLPHAIPWNQAMACLMRGKFIEADEALRLGIANEVVPHGQLLQVAERWAREILENAPLAVCAIKEAARRGQEIPAMDRMYQARDVANRVLLSQDSKEGITAFKEKRKANWVGR